MRLLMIVLLNLSLSTCVNLQRPQARPPDPLFETTQTNHTRSSSIPTASPQSAPPDGHPRDLGFSYTLYKRGSKETLVTPHGGQVPLSPDGMHCQQGGRGVDCLVRHLIVHDDQLYLIMSGHIIAIGPDGRDFREVPISGAVHPIFAAFSVNKEAGLVWSDYHKKGRLLQDGKRIIGVLIYQNGWRVLPLTTTAAKLLANTQPDDVEQVNIVNRHEYNVVLKIGTVLPLTTKPIGPTVGSLK